MIIIVLHQREIYTPKAIICKAICECMTCYSAASEGTMIIRIRLQYLALCQSLGNEEDMASQIAIICCCCTKQVLLGENLLEILPELAGWVSVDRKPFCRDCLALFTEEDWDWCVQPSVALGLAEIARLMPRKGSLCSQSCEASALLPCSSLLSLMVSCKSRSRERAISRRRAKLTER
jgi:hypothetical protein